MGADGRGTGRGRPAGEQGAELGSGVTVHGRKGSWLEGVSRPGLGCSWDHPGELCPVPGTKRTLEPPFLKQPRPAQASTGARCAGHNPALPLHPGALHLPGQATRAGDGVLRTEVHRKVFRTRRVPRDEGAGPRAPEASCPGPAQNHCTCRPVTQLPSALPTRWVAITSDQRGPAVGGG